jgi:hypothetical protein
MRLISLPTEIIVIRKPLAVKCFCITFIVLSFGLAEYEVRAAQGKDESQSKQSAAGQNLSTPPPQATPTQTETKQTEAEPSGGERQRKQEDAASDAKKPMTRAEAYTLALGFMTLLAIAFQAYIYWGQLGEMRKLRRLTQRQFEFIAVWERPDLYIKKVEMADLAIGVPIKVNFFIANAGRVTAHKPWLEGSATLWPTASEDPIWHIESPAEYTDSIPATGGSRMLLRPPFRLTQEQILGLQHGRLMLLIFGFIRYEDATGKRTYETPFCRMYNPATPNEPRQCPSNIRGRIKTKGEEQKDKPN